MERLLSVTLKKQEAVTCYIELIETDSTLQQVSLMYFQSKLFQKGNKNYFISKLF